MPELLERTPDGGLLFSPHPGQWRAWNSLKRFVAVIAGTQGGKTSFGPPWLYREIQQQGIGDYVVVTPTFALLEKKALPEFLRLFERWLKLGKYSSAPVRRFVFSEEGSLRTFGTYDPDRPTTVFFGYAEDPESLESATYKGGWCDEPGQKKFKLASWEALLRRLSLSQGRLLLTTTPYDLGWLKQQIYDRWKRIGTEAEQPGDADYDVIRFDSTENPQFPQAEFERARRDLPRWKFNLFYRGIFTRPAGQIYDSFIDEYAPLGHKCAPFVVPEDWPRYLGLDFGAVNTAGVFLAQSKDKAIQVKDIVVLPPNLLYLYRTYKAGSRTASEHVHHLLHGELTEPFAVGGAGSEDQWRDEFGAAGLRVFEPPITDVEVQIDRVYGCHARSEIIVFDSETAYLEQKATYSRELDDQGEPTEKIDNKAAYHYLDAERYIIAYLRDGRKPLSAEQIMTA